MWKQFLLLLLICFGSMVLPVDVSAYHKATTYTETTIKKYTPKKKKRNRRHRRKPYFNIICEPIIAGGGWLTPIDPIIDEKPHDGPLKNMADAKTKFVIPHDYKNNNTPSSQKDPYQPIEAVLPALASVSAFSKKKKK